MENLQPIDPSQKFTPRNILALERFFLTSIARDEGKKLVKAMACLEDGCSFVGLVKNRPMSNHYQRKHPGKKPIWKYVEISTEECERLRQDNYKRAREVGGRDMSETYFMVKRPISRKYAKSSRPLRIPEN